MNTAMEYATPDGIATYPPSLTAIIRPNESKYPDPVRWANDIPGIAGNPAAIRDIPVSHLDIASLMKSCFSLLTILSVNKRSTNEAYDKGNCN